MNPDVEAIQRAYPQVYHACHVEHRSRHASPSGLTEKDASLLAHAGASEGVTPGALARHFGVAASTLSAQIKRLEAMGLIALEPDPADSRRRRLSLTDQGRAATRAGSVLDAGRLTALLDTLNTDERRRAVEGLTVLAEGARRLRAQSPGN